MKQDLAKTILLLTPALAGEFRLFPLTSPDSPVFLAVALPSHDGVTGLKPRLPSGRGLTPQQALVAAGAEALELRASLAQRHQSTLADLPRTGGQAMVTAHDLVTGQAVPVPAQQVFLDCAATLGEPLVCDATSAGCATGATRSDATEAALRECIERDALALWWHGRLPARPLQLEVIDRHHPRLFWWLSGRDRVTTLLDITTDIGLPVAVAVSSGAGGRQVATGSAARPLLADAALAAVTEMVQTEVAMDGARAAGDMEVALWDAHGSTARQPQFHARDGTCPEPPVSLLQRLADLGLRALAVDLTLPEDPLPTMRVLVPGLCAMGGRTDTTRFRRLCPSIRSPCFPEPY